MSFIFIKKKLNESKTLLPKNECLHNPCCLLKLIKVRVANVCVFFYRKGSLSQFTVLCEKYQPSIERDPVYKEVRRVCFFSLSNIESACNTIKIFCSSM